LTLNLRLPYDFERLSRANGIWIVDFHIFVSIIGLSWAGNPERKGNLNEQTIQDRPLAVAMVEGTPAGTIVLAASEIGLAFVSFQGLQDFKALVLDKANATSSSALEIVQAAGCQVQEYFDHKRKKFDLPLDMEGQPEFRQAVLRETQRIPYGTLSRMGRSRRASINPGGSCSWRSAGTQSSVPGHPVSPRGSW
jgi:hypothetical protein